MLVILRNIILLIVVSIFICQCSSLNYYTDSFIYSDSTLKMNESDIVLKVSNIEAKKIAKLNNNSNNKKIKVSDMIYIPDEPTVINEKLVSVNVTEEVPIIDLIIEIARVADINIQIDPTIFGGIILNVKDKPLRYIFNRICGSTNIKYQEKNGIIVFSKDIPYTKTYVLDFIDLTRSGTSSMSLSTAVISTSGGTSSASVSSSSTDQFWTDIQTNIKQIIDNTEKLYLYYAKYTKQIQKKQQDAFSAQLNNQDDNAPQKTSQMQNDSSSETTTDDSGITGGAVNFNKRSGLMNVTASEKSHRLIEQYLITTRRKTMAQVLIEMKFLEINLSKQFETGVDWSSLGSSGNNLKFATKVAGGSISKDANGVVAFTAVKDGGLNATVKMFEKFGSIRTLSNPRINALNNQITMLTVAQNKVYFKTQVTVQPGSASSGNTVQGITNVTATAQVVPIGIVMSVVPSIDLDNRTIMLNMRPTISKFEEGVQDPSLQIAAANAAASGNADSSDAIKEAVTNTNNNIPQTSIREFDVIMNLNDGQLGIVGGFTQRINETQETGVPILKSIPLIGNLFKYKTETYQTIETIILLKATIIDDGGKLQKYDENFYHDFSDDPRDLYKN